MSTIRIGLIGDYVPSVLAHQAIPQAIQLAAASINKDATFEWLATPRVADEGSGLLSQFNGLWCTPNCPYVSMNGALFAIRFARERSVSYLGSCGGFQHAVIEFARNVLGIADADHAESSPHAATPVISPLSCSLIEKSGKIFMKKDSRLRTICGCAELQEVYHCNYGLNPAYQARFNGSAFNFVGEDENGEVRAAELDGHPFFFATLFQPERSAFRGEVHPLIRAFLLAAK